MQFAFFSKAMAVCSFHCKRLRALKLTDFSEMIKKVLHNSSLGGLTLYFGRRTAGRRGCPPLRLLSAHQLCAQHKAHDVVRRAGGKDKSFILRGYSTLSKFLAGAQGVQQGGIGGLVRVGGPDNIRRSPPSTGTLLAANTCQVVRVPSVRRRVKVGFWAANSASSQRFICEKFLSSFESSRLWP